MRPRGFRKRAGVERREDCAKAGMFCVHIPLRNLCVVHLTVSAPSISSRRLSSSLTK